MPGNDDELIVYQYDKNRLEIENEGKHFSKTITYEEFFDRFMEVISLCDGIEDLMATKVALK